ncbi:methyltransferase domain-containing protein [Stigmatella sp. ncwal1]|uniref:Methyltransferase domain-containing protein n=1 Tax=Stigmatella ashevillensis TaxID=2995309 RepID=A0ABT5DJE1_9BACT|nr:methyltransferase domain-containing protein [Stigmatella ashevillena]MDC0713775.1 methyltransferase domain-containing protein [Stigmatella ashevillena]
MGTDFYLLGHESAEAQRLIRQAQELAGETSWLFDQLDIPVGARAIDLGCGPRGVLDQLSARVGPSGTVVGLDRGEDTLARARAFVAEQGLHNVELVQGDARATGQPPGSFDLVHARLVLVNVPRPEEIAREMVALARPGGAVASHEADYLPHRCDPPCPAWDRLFELFQAHSRDHGVDLFVGSRSHRLLREAGLTDIQVRPLVSVYPKGHPRREIFVHFIQNVRTELLEAGRIEAKELDALMTELVAHLAREDVLVISHMFFQVWGRKPHHAG